MIVYQDIKGRFINYKNSITSMNVSISIYPSREEIKKFKIYTKNKIAKKNMLKTGILIGSATIVVGTLFGAVYLLFRSDKA